MKRLTTNKEVSEMSMIELAYNSCYAKDHLARYRDYDTDIDARELAIKLLEKFDISIEFTCDEDFDDFMLDASQYGIDQAIGLIALFYRNLWAMADLRERLKEYEDLEEQGLLMKLPCKVGDTVYRFWYADGVPYRVQKQKIRGLSNLVSIMEDGKFGKTVFLTQAEAEEALKGMEEKSL